MLGALLLGFLPIEPPRPPAAAQSGPTVPAAIAPARFEFAPGPLADLVARLGPEQVPAALDRADLAADWSAPATFERWRAALSEARDGDTRPARARLALLALRQDRAAEAWKHLELAGADATLLAALLPRFLPGIADDAPVGAGGLAGPLPDGAVLRPCTPPRTRPVERGRIERRAMRVRGLRVGEAVLGLRVAVEPEGVQIDIEHISGGAARVAVRLPTEPGFALANEYVDWFQAEQRGVAHVVEIRPGDEEHTLYGRFEPSESAPEFVLPPAAPAALGLGGLAIRPEPGPEGRSRAEALARALSGAPLNLDARVLDDRAQAPGWQSITLDLSDPRTSSAKVAALCGAVERFTLR
ncbi:MAG: hypothetical protein NTY35_12010 [Planctomycetota bacterium]|nr:hypothetical protein [Planctomycetota bacterium]